MDLFLAVRDRQCHDPPYTCDAPPYRSLRGPSDQRDIRISAHPSGSAAEGAQ